MTVVTEVCFPCLIDWLAGWLMEGWMDGCQGVNVGKLTGGGNCVVVVVATTVQSMADRSAALHATQTSHDQGVSFAGLSFAVGCSRAGRDRYALHILGLGCTHHTNGAGRKGGFRLVGGWKPSRDGKIGWADTMCVCMGWTVDLVTAQHVFSFFLKQHWICSEPLGPGDPPLVNPYAI